MGWRDPALPLLRAAASQSATVAPGRVMDLGSWYRARAAGYRSGNHSAQDHSPLPVCAAGIVSALFGLDAMALRKRPRVRRGHVDLRVQRLALDGAVGLGHERRSIWRGAAPGVYE